MSELIVRGWLRENERLALRRWACGKTVLELGAYEGLSTLQLASTAKGVVTVDTFDGKGTNEPKDTEEILWGNLQKAGQDICPVQVHKGLFSEVLPRLDRKFDLVFIDGSHDYESVVADINLSEPLLNPGGMIAFHDYDTEDPGVVQAVDELVAAGAKVIAQADSLVLVSVDPPTAAEPRPVKIVIAYPHRDGWAHYGSVVAATSQATKRYESAVVSRGNSVLTLTFNQCLAEALNLRDKEGFTHFAMLHNDVVPDNGWLDVLMDELTANSLDMISAVVPIKNSYGLTSTGLDTPGNPWTVRRLTMKEVFELPETFTAKDVPYRLGESGMVLNSGCTLMKLQEPWVQGLHFRQLDKISWCLIQQEWGAMSISEDWDMSRQLLGRGCRLGATRKVHLYHQIPQYNNTSVWGEWTQDQDFLQADRETNEYKAAQAKE